MTEIDIPNYFLCPISLQIMKDPVTAVTGITYDRESIEKWLITAAPIAGTAPICPVTKQLLLSPDLTPNHMLRRLIQAWCTANAVDRIPTPKYPPDKTLVRRLIRDVNSYGNNLSAALKKLAEIAAESERSRQVVVEAGAGDATALFIIRRVKDSADSGLEDGLKLLNLTWNSSSVASLDLIRSLQWVLKTTPAVKTTNALLALKTVMETVTSSLTEKLERDFFDQTTAFLRDRSLPPPAKKSILQILIQSCSASRNRSILVESGAVADLIEMELGNPEKRTSELIFGLLAQLCSSADGRQKLLRHAGGIAVVAKRLLRVSAAADECAVIVMEAIARFAGTREVVMEMLRVGAVAKLCMVLQADCTEHLKKKAREVLRLHSVAWSNSPCIQVYLLTRNPR